MKFGLKFPERVEGVSRGKIGCKPKLISLNCGLLIAIEIDQKQVYLENGLYILDSTSSYN